MGAPKIYDAHPLPWGNNISRKFNQTITSLSFSDFPKRKKEKTAQVMCQNLVLVRVCAPLGEIREALKALLKSSLQFAFFFMGHMQNMCNIEVLV